MFAVCGSMFSRLSLRRQDICSRHEEGEEEEEEDEDDDEEDKDFVSISDIDTSHRARICYTFGKLVDRALEIRIHRKLRFQLLNPGNEQDSGHTADRLVNQRSSGFLRPVQALQQAIDGFHAQAERKLRMTTSPIIVE